MSMAGRVALVTGGTRGIGHATATELARRGATVVLTGRVEAVARSAADDIAAATGAAVTGVPLDVADFGAVEQAVRGVAADHGRLDVLVANAGVMDNGPVGTIQADRLRHTFEVNVFGVIAGLQAAARVMMRRRAGSIVLVGSIVGRDGAAAQLVYGASKAAVASATRSAAVELGRWGIRVNAVAPGVIATDFTRQLPESLLERHAADTPLGRLGTPEDVARVIAFLAGDDAAFVTGQTLAVDGGLVL